MLTQTEINGLMAQINVAFEADRARLDALEARVKELEAAAKPASTRKSTEKAA